MNSIELINKLYKPYRITKQGSATILESMEGKFVVKSKGKSDPKELFEYLKNRGFSNYPNLIDDSRSEVNIYEYVEDAKYPKDQKAIDMIRLVASLHNKTSYNKEVREDKFKEIYDNIKGNLDYFQDKYQSLVLKIEENVFMSPSEYLFIRNSSKLLNQVAFSKDKLDSWYDRVKDKHEYRVSVVHNKLALEHYVKGNKEALISWEDASLDSPILDIYNLYKKEALNLEFGTILKEYLRDISLTDDERDLLFILLCTPKEVEFSSDEFTSCKNISEAIDLVYKTEWLVRPYYSIDDEEK